MKGLRPFIKEAVFTRDPLLYYAVRQRSRRKAAPTSTLFIS